MASKELRDVFRKRGIHDLPDETEQFTRELREMADRETDGHIAVLTGKWIDRKHRGVEIRRLSPNTEQTTGGARSHDGVGGAGAEESDRLAADLIRMALEDLGEAYPKEIAEATGLSPKTVTNNLPALEKKAVICYTGKKGPGGTKQVALHPALVSQKPGQTDSYDYWLGG